MELSCGDSEHLPTIYPIEDAIIEESDAERIERIRRKIENEKVEVLRAIADRAKVQTDHTLKIIK